VNEQQNVNERQDTVIKCCGA